MKENINPDDAKLSALLRQSRASPSLPPRFQENVWRRIEDSEADTVTGTWLDALAALILRPRFALIAATILIVAGIAFGAREGNVTAQKDARTQYIAAVEPAAMH
ncbi:MAG TPA: hypothetical protein VGY56_05070 [Verrucomicrobiae bacterium]|nr:hypothetical protein [Verrucomicrobiae bacterium]